MMVPTPYSILNDPDDGEDVFETIIPTTDAYSTEKRAARWARFSDLGIGNPDKAYWERCMTNKATEIEDRYDIKMRVFSEYKSRLALAVSVDLSDGKMESKSVNKLFDPPEVTVANADATSFLADQNETDFTQTTHGGLEPETVAEYMAAIRNPFEEWAREFDKLFYWGI